MATACSHRASHVGAGAVVRDSIVMFDTVIGRGAVVDRAIIDKECRVGRGAQIGTGTSCGRTAASRSASTPGLPWSASRPACRPRVTIGRNCRIDPGVRRKPISAARLVRSGETSLTAETPPPPAV